MVYREQGMAEGDKDLVLIGFIELIGFVALMRK